MVACPSCGSRFLRPSRPRTFKERINEFRFISPLRCLDCKTRFIASTLDLKDLFFARCPLCFRMDLNVWTGKNYKPPFRMAFLLLFGAHKWRCEYCRHNFVSFRNRKEVFTFARWRKLAERKSENLRHGDPGEHNAEGERGSTEEETRRNAQGSRHN